jgi:hypothetical protein
MNRGANEIHLKISRSQVELGSVTVGSSASIYHNFEAELHFISYRSKAELWNEVIDYTLFLS